MFRSIAVLILSLTTLTAQGALLGRAALTPGGTDYQAYYDTGLNITWLANANLAATSTFGVPGIEPNSPYAGLMNWETAQNWIAALNTVNYLDVSLWRLPATVQPDSSCQTQEFSPSYGQVSFGQNCTGSEMGHQYGVNGVSYFAPGPFQNLNFYNYWSGTDFVGDSTAAWNFRFDVGQQELFQKASGMYAWAVHDGDPLAVVPVPPAVWLFGSALGLMGWMRRKLPT